MQKGDWAIIIAGLSIMGVGGLLWYLSSHEEEGVEPKFSVDILSVEYL